MSYNRGHLWRLLSVSGSESGLEEVAFVSNKEEFFFVIDIVENTERRFFIKQNTL